MNRKGYRNPVPGEIVHATTRSGFKRYIVQVPPHTGMSYPSGMTFLLEDRLDLCVKQRRTTAAFIKGAK